MDDGNFNGFCDSNVVDFDRFLFFAVQHFVVNFLIETERLILLFGVLLVEVSFNYIHPQDK